MKELSQHKQIRVIQLFLKGYSYDEITLEADVAKGSVVNITNKFREGEIQLPAGNSDYIDLLREVAVDLRKSNTNIQKVQKYLRLQNELEKLGATEEEAEQWIETCRDLASSLTSSKQFIESALDLSKASSASGLSYRELVSEYTTKVQNLEKMNREIEHKRGNLEEAEQENVKQKELAIKELNTIQRTIASVQESYHRQKKELETQFDDYLEQNKINWDNAKLITSAIDSGLDINDLKDEDIAEIRKSIIKTGSIYKLLEKLDKRKNIMESAIKDLQTKIVAVNNTLSKARLSNQDSINSVADMRLEKDSLNNQLQVKTRELSRLDSEISEKSEDLYMSQLIIDFLLSPKDFSNRDLDRLTGLLITLRQRRLGITPGKVTDKNGNVICECIVPKLYDYFNIDEVNTDHAREVFAYYLTPLVRDKFVTRFEFDLAMTKKELSQEIAVINATIEERNRHIL
jgi:chromosome segregation ATPase